jgi:hypothetical protein
MSNISRALFLITLVPVLLGTVSCAGAGRSVNMPELQSFATEGRLAAYEDMSARAHALWQSRSMTEVRLGSIRLDGIEQVLRLNDRDGDRLADQFVVVGTTKEKDSKFFGFFFDLNGDGRVDYLVVSGGILPSKDFSKIVWKAYHWIDSNTDGRVDIVVSNDVDLDGDRFYDPGLTSWIFDRDFDGLYDSGEYVGPGIRMPCEVRAGVLEVKGISGPKEYRLDDPTTLSAINAIFTQILEALL